MALQERDLAVAEILAIPVTFCWELLSKLWFSCLFVAAVSESFQKK